MKGTSENIVKTNWAARTGTCRVFFPRLLAVDCFTAAVVPLPHHDDPTIALTPAPGGAIGTHGDGPVERTALAYVTLIVAQGSFGGRLRRKEKL